MVKCRYCGSDKIVKAGLDEMLRISLLTYFVSERASQKNTELGKYTNVKIEQKPNGFCSSPTSLVIAVRDLLKKLRHPGIPIVLKNMW